MAREAAEIRLIRETLEGVLHPASAAAVFYDAIRAYGTLPSDYDATLSLVRGALSDALGKQLGVAEGRAIVEQLEGMMETLRTAPKVRKKPSRHNMPTAAMQVNDGTLPLYVLAASREFADLLKAVLGPEIMTALAVSDSRSLRAYVRDLPPIFVLIDASNFPAIEPVDLVDQLSRLRPRVVKALWGSDLPYGQSVLAAAQKQGVTVTPFDREEGIAPLVDVIRSCRR